MRVTRWGEYGILCSLYLARKEAGAEKAQDAGASLRQAVGAAEIASAQEMPLQYAHQVLHRLRKGGIVKSIRGPRGGFALTKEPRELTLKEILCAAEGTTFDVVCETDPLHEQCCDANQMCGLRGIWQELRTVIDRYLTGITLQSLLEREQSGVPFHVEQLVQLTPHAATSTRN